VFAGHTKYCIINIGGQERKDSCRVFFLYDRVAVMTSGTQRCSEFFQSLAGLAVGAVTKSFPVWSRSVALRFLFQNLTSKYVHLAS